jgi:hypothetical protein
MTLQKTQSNRSGVACTRNEPSFRRCTSSSRRVNASYGRGQYSLPWKANTRENERRAPHGRTRHSFTPDARRLSAEGAVLPTLHVLPTSSEHLLRPWAMRPSMEGNTRENEGRPPHDRTQHGFRPLAHRPSAQGAVLPTSYVLSTSEERHPTTVGGALLHRDQHLGERGQRASPPVLPPLSPEARRPSGGRSRPSDVVRHCLVGRTSSDDRGRRFPPSRPARQRTSAPHLPPGATWPPPGITSSLDARSRLPGVRASFHIGSSSDAPRARAFRRAASTD